MKSIEHLKDNIINLHWNPTILRLLRLYGEKNSLPFNKYNFPLEHKRESIITTILTSSNYNKDITHIIPNHKKQGTIHWGILLKITCLANTACHFGSR